MYCSWYYEEFCFCIPLRVGVYISAITLALLDLGISIFLFCLEPFLFKSKIFYYMVLAIATAYGLFLFIFLLIGLIKHNKDAVLYWIGQYFFGFAVRWLILGAYGVSNTDLGIILEISLMTFTILYAVLATYGHQTVASYFMLELVYD